MKKKAIDTIHEKNSIVNNIINTIDERNHFLILGHKNPDEDCVASMVSFALIISKFSKKVSIFQSEKIHEHFQYLINICTYNSIKYSNTADKIGNLIDTIVVCDTPKPSMIDSDSLFTPLMNNKEILKLEVDHHLGADSEYIGDEGYCLVTEASSASELVGLIALKLRNRKDLIERYHISNPLSRNIVLSVVTGIVGDTNMGQFIKSRRERKYYNMFSKLYNNLLAEETVKGKNFTDKREVFQEIQRLSVNEEMCFNYIYGKKRFSSSIGYVILNRQDMDLLNKEFASDTIVSISRAVANNLAEESTRLGLIVYDDTSGSGLMQFRLRRGHGYKSFDVRDVLDIFSIENGGGHEGAIGFRIKGEEIDDLDSYVERLISGIEKVIAV